MELARIHRSALVRTAACLLVIAALGGCARVREKLFPSYREIRGIWRGYGWGRIFIDGNRGVYTEAAGSPAGAIRLKKAGSRSYSGTWRDSGTRHGTLNLALSADGDTLAGLARPDPDCDPAVADRAVHWRREGNPSSDPGDYSELEGAWNGYFWGTVTIKGRRGVYSATCGTGPGLIEFTKTGTSSYDGAWGESEQRHGAMKVVASADGSRIDGVSVPDPGCRVGSRDTERLYWVRIVQRQ